MSELSLDEFCQAYLETIKNKPTSYKKHKNPSSIDMILTNEKET